MTINGILRLRVRASPRAKEVKISVNFFLGISGDVYQCPGGECLTQWTSAPLKSLRRLPESIISHLLSRTSGSLKIRLGNLSNVNTAHSNTASSSTSHQTNPTLKSCAARLSIMYILCVTSKVQLLDG